MSDAAHDVIVVGAGPAGLAAAMFTARRGLRTLIIAPDIGGQLALTEEIENYPGVDRAGGRELSERMRAQVERDGAMVLFDRAIGIDRSSDSPPTYTIRTAGGNAYIARVIILAFGLTPNTLDVSGEERLSGKGLYYSAVVDAPRQDGKVVAVVGGGNSAVTAALELSTRAASVFLIHRRAEFRAEKTLLDRARATASIERVTPYTVAEVLGSDRLEGVVLAHAEGGASRELTVDSVFVQIGYRAQTQWLGNTVALSAKHEVLIDRDCATNVPGIFAAGDITDIAYKQAVISAGEGTKAGLQAFKYLQIAAGKPAVMFDWDVK